MGTNTTQKKTARESYAARELVTQLEVISEGETMAHCLAASNAYEHVQAGRLMLFAVTGPERLTLSLVRWPDHGMWHLADLAGKANSPPSVDALLWAHELVSVVNEKHNRKLSALPPLVTALGSELPVLLDAQAESLQDDAEAPAPNDASDGADADHTASRRQAREYNTDVYLKVASTLGRTVPINIWVGSDWKFAIDACACQLDDHVLMHWRTTNDDAQGTLLLHGGNTRMAECFVEPGSDAGRKEKGQTKPSAKSEKKGFVMRVVSGRVRYA